MSVQATESVTTPTPTEPPAAATATPGAPPTPTEPPKAADPAPAANPWEDPKAAQAEIERLRKENAKDRTTAKAQAAEEATKELAQTIGKALGLVQDEPLDPAALTASLTQSQAEAKQARVELAVFRNAATAGGDPAALLDSTSFLMSLDGVDPADSEAVTKAITEAVAANSRLSAVSDPRTPAPNPAQGSSASGPAGGPAQLSREDVERLARDGKHLEIDKAREEGRLNTVLGIK